MSARRRAALLAFARAKEVCIVEDDYDSEFRYDGRPLDALQTLDRDGLVFYVGTFSKTLFPALRIGFIVMPLWASTALTRAKELTDWHAPIHVQETLASFFREGHFDRHARKMRRIYAERRTTLLDALEAQGVIC
jgi:GntR family transcriptional regulator / MocR family aminotransferase